LDAPRVTRFEFPEKAKTLAMPVEERVGLEDEECFFSMLDATSEENETHDQLN
jgi:hypothetical protein